MPRPVKFKDLKRKKYKENKKDFSNQKFFSRESLELENLSYFKEKI